MRKKFVVLTSAVLALIVMTVPAIALAHGRPGSNSSDVPSYQHIFEIVLENHSTGDIIGNANAPAINALAKQYGLATDYYGITHPSEPNYVAMVGGDFYGIQDDDAYNLPDHTINQPSLAQQLEGAGLTWKAYEQSLPYAGFTGTTFGNQLYRSKHNGFLNFAAVQNDPAEMQKNVPDTQLFVDLATNKVPNFSFIVPDQCHDMHGTSDCSDDATKVSAGDTYTSQVITAIMVSQTWREGNNAIVITFDEGDTDAGCCDAGTHDPNNLDSGSGGGGQIVTIVITNHGPRGLQVSTPYNHYSLLLTVEDAFGLGCLANTCDSANVQPMTPLFATGHGDDHGHGH
jgi:hypothetical protein